MTRIKDALTNMLIVFLILYMLSMAFEAVTSEPTPSTKDARAQAQEQWRKDLGADALCRQETGYGSTYQWSASNEIVCIPPKPIK